MRAITTRRELIGHWRRMRRSLAQFSELDALYLMPWLADCITNTPAAEFMHPTFKATAVVVGGDDFARRLEAAIERSGVGPKMIEATVELPPTGPAPTPANAPFTSPRRRG